MQLTPQKSKEKKIFTITLESTFQIQQCASKKNSLKEISRRRLIRLFHNNNNIASDELKQQRMELHSSDYKVDTVNYCKRN